jgi:hypothetical protein
MCVIAVIRRTAQSVSLLVPAATLVSLSLGPAGPAGGGALPAALHLAAAGSAAAVCVAGFASSVQDLCRSPRLVSVVYGVTSVPAVLLGSLVSPECYECCE